MGPRVFALPPSWGTWGAVLKASFGERLSPSERRAFASVSGGRKPPRKRVGELWVAAGRRSGKSRMASLAAAHVGALESHAGKLAPGEPGYVLVLSPTRSQSRVIRDYCEGFLRSNPITSDLITSTTADEIRLDNGVVIATHVNSFRSVRGRSLLACVFDESAFWQSENSASPDTEVYSAVLPALAAAGGMLISISSAYRPLGLLHAKVTAAFGKDDPDVLAIRAPTVALNPTIDRAVIARARANDPEAARSEWDSEWREGITSLLDDAWIDAAIDRQRPAELPYRPEFQYVCFADASGGRHDQFCACTLHFEDGRFVLDALMVRKAPLDPAAVAREAGDLAKRYHCTSITSDAYAGEWVANAFRATGLEHRRAPMAKSGLYLEMLPKFAQGAVSIPEHPGLIRELRLLERHVTPSGRDRVDHPQQGGSDDAANVLAGAIVMASRQLERPVWTAGQLIGVATTADDDWDGGLSNLSGTYG